LGGPGKRKERGKFQDVLAYGLGTEQTFYRIAGVRRRRKVIRRNT